MAHNDFLFCFIKGFPNTPSLLKIFWFTYDCWNLSKEGKVMCCYFSLLFLPSGAALLFQSVGFAKAWHTALPKFWTYTQVRVCNLAYSTAFNVSCGMYKWKENTYAWQRETKHLVVLDVNKTSRSFWRNFRVPVKKMPGAGVWLVLAGKQPWRCKIADKQRTAKQLLSGRYWIAVLGSSARYWMNALQPGLVKAWSVLTA